MASSSKQNKRYIASLDGLRALAVMAVIFYHLQCTWAQGGLLGVTVFFVLSGYLITGLLVGEWLDTGGVDLKRFWLRRVRRLFPAIALVVAVVAALCVIFNHPLLTKMRPDILPSLFWFQNWWYVFRGLSYFDALGDPSPLTHFWSLAIEEQFYVVWPLILLCVFKLAHGRHDGHARALIRRGCLFFAIVSAVLMGVLYDPHADPTRVYYGTDTRAFSLLIGGWLSIAWPGNGFSEESVSHEDMRAVRGLDLVGGLALAGVVIMMVTVDGMSPFMYRGGILLCSILTAIVIAALVHPHSLLARAASWEPFVWIGQRSYGMYLWHYPVILLLKPLNTAEDGYAWWFMLGVVAITFGVSALSYRYVENPIRHGAIGKWWKARRERSAAGERGIVATVTGQTLANTVTAGVFGSSLFVALVGGMTVPDVSAVPQGAIVSTGAAADKAMVAKPIEEPGEAQLSDEELAAAEQKAQQEKKKKAGPVHQKGVYNPLLIGDSVPGDAYGNFKPHFPYGLNDSFVGRSFEQARSVYADYKEQGVVGQVVIFACFSNQPLEPGELKKMRKMVGKKKDIFLVNIEAPERFESNTNEQLSKFAKKYKNVRLIDWNATVKGHKRSYLYADGEHLTPSGAKVYYKMIRKAVKKYLPKKDIK